jgi:hypothetical protein
MKSIAGVKNARLGTCVTRNAPEGSSKSLSKWLGHLGKGARRAVRERKGAKDGLRCALGLKEK